MGHYYHPLVLERNPTHAPCRPTLTYDAMSSQCERPKTGKEPGKGRGLDPIKTQSPEMIGTLNSIA